MAAAVEEEESAEAAADGEGDEAALKEMEVGGPRGRGLTGKGRGSVEGAGPEGGGGGASGRGPVG